MPRVPWHLFQRRQRDAHLVVGVGAQTDRATTGDELQEAQSVLTRFVKKQRLSGDYAATVVRDSGRPELYFAFEEEGAAQELAAVLKAKVTESYQGWASQRAFELDGETLAAVEATLPLSKPGPRHPPAEGSSMGRRIRRGPWTPVKRDDDR